MDTKKITLCLILVTLILFAWMGRYEVIPIADNSFGGAAFRLDRWTGKMIYVVQTASFEVDLKPEK